MILSHHGKLEFGSPKVPLFPEALLLHYLDDMDSKMECMRATAEKGAQAEGLFTAWSSSLERVVLRKERYLAKCAEPSSAPAAPIVVAGTAEASGFADKLRQALVPERSQENG
jgi:3'-5' exoribonuclease